MGRWSKRLKKYERHVLLSLVILLLVSFSITGAIKCQRGGGNERADHSGSFNVTPSKRESLTTVEVDNWWNRYSSFLRFNTPSFLYPISQLHIKGPERFGAFWEHAMPVAAAREAGYHCGDEYQLKTAIRKVVQGVMGGLEFNDATYDQFLREYWVGSASTFQDTVREIVLKDMFERPLIDTSRYAVSWPEAYEDWKHVVERVNLRYVALSAADFSLPARERERTRERIGRQMTLLDEVSATVRTLEALQTKLATYSKTHGGKAPEKLADVAPDAATKDAWGHDIRYVASESGGTLTSAGPDGTMDTVDDVTPGFAPLFHTLGTLREVGTAIEAWRAATSSWPESLDAMRKPPKSGEPVPLKTDGKDGWGNVVVYEAPKGEGELPRLFSAGPDGKPGTPDDVAAEVEEKSVRVGPSAGEGPTSLLRPFLLHADDADKDVWGHPLRIELDPAGAWRWKVISAGPDGEFGTSDDLDTGNERELERYFQTVKQDYTEPPKRSFAALYVHLPLMPNDALATLWKKYPDLHPDETDAYKRWRQLYGVTYYTAKDPADPKEGHGAELAHELDPDHEPVLVPDVSTFGTPPPDLVGANDPDGKIYLEKGWRPILLRELFVEKLLNHLLTEARESQAKVKEWENKKAAFEKKEGEDPGPRPEELTFDKLLHTELADVLPGPKGPRWLGLYTTPKPLTQTEWESDPDVGDMNLSVNMQKVTGTGEYKSIPITLHGGNTRVIVRNLAYQAQRQKDLDEVRDVVFDKFVDTKRLDVAAEVLQELQKEIQKASAAAPPAPPEPAKPGETPKQPGQPGQPPAPGSPGQPGEAPGAAPAEPIVKEEVFAKALASWKERTKAKPDVGTTGLFVGRLPPPSTTLPDDLPEDQKLEAERRDFVRQRGFVAVRGTKPYDEDVEIGTIANDVLKDTAGKTESVYLVQLLDSKLPPPEAFSPRDYADYVTSAVIGGPIGGLKFRNVMPADKEKKGLLPEALEHFFGPIDYLKEHMHLRTAAPLTSEE